MCRVFYVLETDVSFNLYSLIWPSFPATSMNVLGSKNKISVSLYRVNPWFREKTLMVFRWFVIVKIYYNPTDCQFSKYFLMIHAATFPCTFVHNLFIKYIRTIFLI